MAEMLASIKVLPSTVEVDLEKLKDKIEKALPSNSKLYKVVEEPIAFGLTALITHLILPESESDIMTKIETLLKNIDGVGEIQVINMTRL
jgi:elongation factor 1-beta